jgi:hypothetical protein
MSLLDRRDFCNDRLLRERVAQAILECGQSLNVDTVLVALVKSTEDDASLVTDEQIIAIVESLNAEVTS